MRFELGLATIVVPVFSYWLSIAVTARLLPRQRRMANDRRPVPGLLEGQSHRWFGLVLSETTTGYSPATKRAFLIARLSLLLIPVGLVTGMMLATSGS